MLSLFRLVGILEGVSYLLLFALSMPLKYWAGIGEPNIYIGYFHGILFIGYLALAALNWRAKNWKLKILFYLALASLLPFGTFYLDEKFLKYQK
jgi:integral membrane protein